MDRERRQLIMPIAWDIVLNATIPVACYYLARWYISPSEFSDLIFATAFPIIKSIYDLTRRRELDPVAVIVLLGIVTSLIAIFFGGGPKLLLIRESFFTGAFGLACFISLAFPRPIMFYFGRYFMVSKDPQRRHAYNERWHDPYVRHAHRLITTVWGSVYVGEFIIRVILVYTTPAPIVLVVSPFLIGIATTFTIVWTFRYAYKVRDQVSAARVG